MAVTITDASLSGIYNRLHAIPEHHPYVAQTFADWAMQAGDVVTVSQGEDSYSSPVHSVRTVWKGTPETEISVGGNKQHDPVSTASQKKYRRGSAAQRSQEIIQSTLEDEVTGVRSTVTQLANEWSVIVEGTGQNAHIKPAVIQASIDAATLESKIRLSATHVEIDGQLIVDSLGNDYDMVIGGIMCDTIQMNGITEVNLNAPLIPVNGSGDASWGDVIVRAEVDSLTNTLKLWSLEDEGGNPTVTFSKATSLSGAWSGDVLTVSASPQGNTYGIGFGTNYGAHEKDLEVVVKASGIVQSQTAGSIDIPLAVNELSGAYSPPVEKYTRTATAYIGGLLDTLSVTPTSSQQSFTPGSGYIGFSSVTVAAGQSAGVITSIVESSDAVPSGQTKTSGSVTVKGTNITNAPYAKSFSMGYESFTPSGTSVNTAAVYFSIDGVKIGRYSDSNLLAANIKNGVSIMGITGSYSPTVTLEDKGTITPTTSDQTLTPSSGYDGISQVKVKGSSNLIASNIKSGVTIFNVTGSYSPNASIDSVSEIHGAISGDTTARSSMTVRASGTNVSSKDQGYTLQKAIHSDQNFVEVLEGTSNPITVGRISTESVWNAGMTFQLGKMVPFIGDQSNEAYNNRITTITSNGTYYACAEGYKDHTTGYDNTTYSSDRYATGRSFTVNVSSSNPYPYTRTLKCVYKSFSSGEWVYRFEIAVSTEVWNTNTNYKFHHNSGYT